MRKRTEQDGAQPGPETLPPESDIEAAAAAAAAAAQVPADDDPFSLANLRMAQNFDTMFEVERLITHIPVRKPSRDEFFRVRDEPGWNLDTYLLEDKTDGRFYLIAPKLVPYLLNKAVHVRLVVAIVHHTNVLLLWPLRLPDPSGRVNSWHASALEAAEMGKRSWTGMEANQAAKSYTVKVARNADLPGPDWPDITFEKVLDIAFRGYRMATPDHPLVQRLEGMI